MSVLSWLRGESRDMSSFATATDDDLFGARSTAGVKVTHDSALSLVAVYACVSLISDSIAALPVDCYRTVNGTREESPKKPEWLIQPNPDQTWRQFLSRVLHSLLIAGNAFVMIGNRGSLAYPSELWVLHPADVTVKQEKGKPKSFEVEGKKYKPFTRLTPDGQILHLMNISSDGIVGLSPIDLAQQAIGLGLAAEQFGARWFGQGSQPSGVIEMPANSMASEEQLKGWSKLWRRKFSGVENAHLTPVLGNGATFKPITIPNDQAQFIETRSFSVSEIARLYRVPPHLIGDVERSTSWGTGIEEQNIGFVTFTLGPRIQILEEGLSQLLQLGDYIRFNVNGLLRGDAKTRFEAYQTGIINGFMSRNEVRQLEDRAVVDGLDDFLVPVQAQLLGGEEDRSVEDPAVLAVKMNAVGLLIRSGFKPEAALQAVGLNPIDHFGLLPVTLQSPDKVLEAGDPDTPVVDLDDPDPDQEPT